VEFSALTTHLMWTESVGENQAELERIVHSLEANPFLRGYQSWHKRCEIIPGPFTDERGSRDTTG
jgi:hypothetical protein